MERMTTLDSEFLNMEDSETHMHIGGLCTFEDPPPPFEEFSAMIASKLHRIPRYRQRVRTVPLELGRPVWVDDPHFNLDYHLRHTALPAPGGDAELHRLMGRIQSQPLDRDRPLWETWLVEGLDGGRWALVFKLHHCMVDGVAGVGLLEVVLDLAADREIGEPEPWSPESEPGGVEKVLDAWGGAIEDGRRWLGTLAGAVAEPVAALEQVVALGSGFLQFGDHLSITPESSLTGRIGPHRVWTHRGVDLTDVKKVGHTLGGTVNDVVLTAITAGYRELLMEQGDDPEEVVVRSVVPVSVRGEDGDGVLDNRVSTLLLELPVDCGGALECFAEVKLRMEELKASHMADFGSMVTDVGDLAPPVVVGMVTRWGTQLQHRAVQRSITTVTTNIPGPQFPLYCLGSEMLDYLPFVPITQGTRVGTAILSYNGKVAFGFTGDFDAAPALEVLGDGILSGMDALLELT